MKAKFLNLLELSIHEFAGKESAYLGKYVAIFKDKHLFECVHGILWVKSHMKS